MIVKRRKTDHSEMRSFMNDEEYYNFVRPYADAMQMLLTRLDVLNHNLYGKSDSRPIHYIQNRIKKKKSLEEKLIRRGKRTDRRQR